MGSDSGCMKGPIEGESEKKMRPVMLPPESGGYDRGIVEATGPQLLLLVQCVMTFRSK